MSWFEGFGRTTPGSRRATRAPGGMPRRDDGRARRSTLVRLVVALGLSGALVACGFQLRGDARFPFASIYVTAPVSPPFEAEMRRMFEGAGTLAASPSSAQVVLDVSNVADDKSVLSLSSSGRVREFALAKRV